MADIHFICKYCGKKLAADERAAGTGAPCPECGKTVFVPQPPAAQTSTGKVRVVKVHSAAATPAPDPHAAAAPHKTAVETALAWVCLGVAIALAMAMPRLFWVYGPFLLVAAAMGIALILQGRGLPGTLLVLTALVAAPGLACLRMAAARAPAPAPREATAARKLVFDAGTGKPVLVPAGPGEVAMPATPGSAPARRETRAAKRHADPFSARPVADSRPSARILGTDREPSVPPAARSDYDSLLGATNEVLPALVPEDVLAATHVEPYSGDDSHASWKGAGEGAPPKPVAAVKATLPFVVYEDCSGDERPYAPSGWMGDTDSVQVEECCEDEPHSGGACVKASYVSTHYWGGVVWQNPPNNWGAIPGGYDLTGATNLIFWARKAEDGPNTVVTFKVGLKDNQPYSDTASVSTPPIRLKTEWKRYSIPLKGQDLSRIISGFVWIVEAADRPITFYVDDVRFE